VIGSLLTVALAVVIPYAHPCRATLPRGPAVPAPIVLRTSCGGFQLTRDGRVNRLPRHWFARHGGGTGRRYGADIAVRRTRAGRFLLLRHGRVIWRSRGLYRNDGGAIAFGPNEFAFVTYRRGVFLTDLKGPERLVMRGRGLFPYAFTRASELLVTTNVGRISVIARDGSVLRRYRFRQRNGVAFDDRTETLYFIGIDGVLSAAQGPRLRSVRALSGVDGMMSFARPGLLIFSGQRQVAVRRLDGSLVASARWRSRLDVFDSGLSVSTGGDEFSFRLSDAHPGARSGTAVLYVLHAGESRARTIYRHRLGPAGCGVGASMFWHGRFLLYSTLAGQRRIFDSSRHEAAIRLDPLVRALPHRRFGERGEVYWASDFH
jgi:hypothetical protein